MATMQIDQDTYRNLARLRLTYSGLLAVNVRSIDELTPAEIALEDDWQKALEPVLKDLYWRPLSTGLSVAPDNPTALRRWIEASLSTGIAVAALLALLRRFFTRAVNVGGFMALDMLGIGGAFHLGEPAYLAQIDDHADVLTTQGSDMSLIDTTIDHLATGIPAAKASDNPLFTIGTMIAGWALYRSVSIAITEGTRAITNGANWTYIENEVAMQRFTTRADDRVCAICAPKEGRTMPVSSIPTDLDLPQHPNCRCIYTPVTAGWTRPAHIWRG